MPATTDPVAPASVSAWPRFRTYRCSAGPVVTVPSGRRSRWKLDTNVSHRPNAGQPVTAVLTFTTTRPRGSAGGSPIRTSC